MRLHFSTSASSRFLHVVTLMAIVVCVLPGCKIFTKKDKPRCAVSIGVFTGKTPLGLKEELPNPVFHPSDVTDRNAWSVADPFVVRDGSTWNLFFEAIDAATGKGDLALATSSDLRSWKYQGVVLSEPFHLSYPRVFKDHDQWYMIPESRQAGAIRLYRADPFPNHWVFDQVLIDGKYADSTIVEAKGKYWIFTIRNAYTMEIWWAESLRGPWHPHAENPIYWSAKDRARMGGGIVEWQGKLVRFSQDSIGGYGKRVRAWIIDALTPEVFAEHQAPESPVLEPIGNGWRSQGMHQYDPHPLDDGSWMAVVDGCGFPAGTLNSAALPAAAQAGPE